jgi:hypothetical protein
MARKTLQFEPSKSHFIGFNEAVAAQRWSLYGKLMDNGESQPSDLGLSHPSDPGAPIHRSVIFGYSEGGSCHTLAQPQIMTLPLPNGPADGCGWNPAEYVVWKDVPPDWTTLHVITERRPVAEAVAAGLQPKLAAVTGVSDFQIISVVRSWAALDSLPQNNDVLSALWAIHRKTDFSSFGAPALAQALQSNLGINILSQSITATMSVQGLLDAVA